MIPSNMEQQILQRDPNNMEAFKYQMRKQKQILIQVENDRKLKIKNFKQNNSSNIYEWIDFTLYLESVIDHQQREIYSFQNQLLKQQFESKLKTTQLEKNKLQIIKLMQQNLKKKKQSENCVENKESLKESQHILSSTDKMKTKEHLQANEEQQYQQLKTQPDILQYPYQFHQIQQNFTKLDLESVNIDTKQFVVVQNQNINNQKQQHQYENNQQQYNQQIQAETNRNRSRALSAHNNNRIQKQKSQGNEQFQLKQQILASGNPYQSQIKNQKDASNNCEKKSSTQLKIQDIIKQNVKIQEQIEKHQQSNFNNQNNSSQNNKNIQLQSPDKNHKEKQKIFIENQCFNGINNIPLCEEIYKSDQLERLSRGIFNQNFGPSNILIQFEK